MFNNKQTAFAMKYENLKLMHYKHAYLSQSYHLSAPNVCLIQIVIIHNTEAVGKSRTPKSFLFLRLPGMLKNAS